MDNDRMIIRNDDVAYDTDPKQFAEFCSICDRFNFPIIQAITVRGSIQQIDISWDNKRILNDCGTRFFNENKGLMDILNARKHKDIFAIHGLFHTHSPSADDIHAAESWLQAFGFHPECIVQPFNEPSSYGDHCMGLPVLAKQQRIEDYLPSMPLHDQIPTDPICYLHSWRFGKWYPMESLTTCLQRISSKLTPVTHL